MMHILKKIDAIVVIIIFTIMIGVVVITLRSKTYSIGYEIAYLKNQEKRLSQNQIELQSRLANVQKEIREKQLLRQDSNGKPKYVMPDKKHVIKEGP